MVHGKNRISYWIDRRLTGLAAPDYDATISFGLLFEPEDSQYGKSRLQQPARRRTAALPDARRSSGSVRRRAHVYQYACSHQHAHAYTHALLHQYAHTYTHADGHTDADPDTRPARSLYVSVSAGAHGLHLVGVGERP